MSIVYPAQARKPADESLELITEQSLFCRQRNHLHRYMLWRTSSNIRWMALAYHQRLLNKLRSFLATYLVSYDPVRLLLRSADGDQLSSFSILFSLARNWSNISVSILPIPLLRLNRSHSNTAIVVGQRFTSWLVFKLLSSSSQSTATARFLRRNIGRQVRNWYFYSRWD